MAALKTQYQAKVDDLYTKYKNSLDKKNKNISTLQSSLSAKTSDYDAYREKAEKELNEHKKYVYDPNYDHYYSDVLPKIVNAIEFTHTDIIIRSSLIALSLAGMDCHEICLYFMMKSRGTQELHSKSTTLDGVKESMYWLLISDLDKYKAFPSFMKDYLTGKHTGIEHIVTDEKRKI